MFSFLQNRLALIILPFTIGMASEKSLASEKLKVIATFYPLAELARQVGGELVDVTNITPTGAEPHDYEPSPRDIIKIRSAKVFLLNGGNIDVWAEKIQNDLKKRGIEVINMSESLRKSTQLLRSQGKNGERFDPHFWLDPILRQEQVAIVRDTFIKVDPENAEYYRKAGEDYINRLVTLDQEYKDGLRHCAIREVVVSHAAFGYLAKRYQLEMIYISGISPDQEPSPRRLAEISLLAREKNIKYIFFETLLSPKLAETVAREIGAKTLVFNPIEGLTDEEIRAGKNYISLMEDNLKNLRIALQCK